MKLQNSQIADKIKLKVQSCLDSNKEFNIPLSEIKAMFDTERCAYTGKKFQNIQDITWERVNPQLGYVSGNVVLVTKGANSHKAQLDAYVKGDVIPLDMKIKLMRKALYQLEKAQRDGN